MAPEWEKLGEKYEDNADVVIAKIDGTANEVDGVAVQGFPTLILFKKDTNEEVTYTGTDVEDPEVKLLLEAWRTKKVAQRL